MVSLETTLYELREHAYDLIRKCNLALHGYATSSSITDRMRATSLDVAQECRTIASGGKEIEAGLKEK